MQEENTEILRDFAFRLNARAEACGFSQVEIGAKLGAKPPRVSNWFQGRNFPRAREKAELAKLLGVTVEWLVQGTGEPERSAVAEEESAYGDQVRTVPLISWTHAGVAASYDAMPKHWQGAVPTTSRDRRAFALTIEGDSMEPKFFAGDRVVCEPSAEPRNGKAVVVKFADDAVQLRIYHKLRNGHIQLASLRPEIYPTQIYTAADFNWIFPVCELVRSV